MEVAIRPRLGRADLAAAVREHLPAADRPPRAAARMRFAPRAP